MKNNALAIAFLIGGGAGALMLFGGGGNNSHPQPVHYSVHPMQQPPAKDTVGPTTVADSPILLNCVRLPDREMNFHMSLDTARQIVIDGDEPPTRYTIDGDWFMWRSQVISGMSAKLNRKTLRLEIYSASNYMGQYLCERIAGLND